MTPPVPPSGFPFARAILLTLVAALLATVLWFGADILALRAKVAAVETERDLATAAQSLAQSQLKERTLLAEGMINDLHRQMREQSGLSRLTVVLLAPSAGSAPAQGVVFWDPHQQTGLLVATQLPVLDGDKVYRAAIIPSNSAEPVGIGTLQPDSSGKAVIDFQLSNSFAGTPKFTVGVVAKNSSLPVPPTIILSGK